MNVSLLTLLNVLFGFGLFLLSGSCLTSNIFGIKTKNSVIDVQKKMNKESRMNAAFLFCTMNAMAAPAEHIISTLYTLIPIYFESFRAGIVTWRVSYAKKQPNNLK